MQRWSIFPKRWGQFEDAPFPILFAWKAESFAPRVRSLAVDAQVALECWDLLGRSWHDRDVGRLAEWKMGRRLCEAGFGREGGSGTRVESQGGRGL